MTDARHNHVSPQEGFEYSFRGFIEAVDMLASEAAEAVRNNGNYNTAFELIHDASVGRYLV